jgi:uncharacterized repeat protein (TIGR01451 family)
MSRPKHRAGRRGILLGSIVGMMLALGQAGTLPARADPPIGSPAPASVDGVQPVIAVTGSDVTIATTNDPDGAILPGSSITYTLTVTNQGDATAATVAVTDQLPVGVSFFDATAGCSEAAEVVTCALGDIGTGASLAVDITVTVGEATCGTLVNSANVSASNETVEAVGNNASNEVSNNVECEEPTPSDLQVSKRSDADGILRDGDDFLYTINVTNVGEEEARGVELVDVLPPSALNVGVPPFPTFGGKACTVTSSAPPGGVSHTEVRCGPVSLDPGETASVTVKVFVSGDVCGPITNVVDVEGANEPAGNIGSDNRAEATDVIACVPRIRLLKDGPSLAHVGDTITYAFTARNDGSVDLSNVDLTDPSCHTSPALIDDGDGDDVLSVDEEWRFGCDHTITAGDGDPIHTQATVAGDHEGGTVTDSDTHDANVIHPRIDLEETASPTSGPAGTRIVYTYTVTNTGDTPLFDVAVDDNAAGHVGDIAKLTAGQTVELTRRITLGSSPLISVGTAAASDLLGSTVSDVDDARVAAISGAGGGNGTGGSAFTGFGAGALAGWTLVLATLGTAILAASRKRSETQG